MRTRTAALLVAGRNAPASIRTPQPIPWSEKDADDIDGLCGLSRR